MQPDSGGASIDPKSLSSGKCLRGWPRVWRSQEGSFQPRLEQHEPNFTPQTKLTLIWSQVKGKPKWILNWFQCPRPYINILLPRLEWWLRVKTLSSWTFSPRNKVRSKIFNVSTLTGTGDQDTVVSLSKSDLLSDNSLLSCTSFTEVYHCQLWCYS